MLYIGFYKGLPSDYIIKFKNGKARKKGRGISFFYSKRKTTIIKIPAKTIDAYFVFNEKTKSYQAVTIQGQLTYQVEDFEKLSTLFDLSINTKTKDYASEDIRKLDERIVNAAQMATTASIKDLSLEETLASSKTIAENIFSNLQDDSYLNTIGVKCLSIHITHLAPTPEMGRALEAEYREMLQKKADEAIYSRRAAAVEQERKIKENELNSQIEIGRKRQELVEIEGNNTVKEAEYNSKAREMELAVYKEMDPKVLLSLGLKSLGENAQKIQSINFTPELLSEILKLKGSK